MKLNEAIKIKHDRQAFPDGIVITATLKVRAGMALSNLEIEHAEKIDVVAHVEAQLRHEIAAGLYGWVVNEIGKAVTGPDSHGDLMTLVSKLIDGDVEINVQQ